MPNDSGASRASFREVMGHFATGVTLVAGLDASGRPVGLTANAVASVSLDPLLLMVSLDRESSSLPSLLEGGCFTVSVLRAEQRHLARKFSEAAPEERFEGLDLQEVGSGLPVLDGSLAWMDCRVWRTVEAGDHVILLGEVTSCDTGPPGHPLVFFQGRYGTMSS